MLHNVDAQTKDSVEGLYKALQTQLYKPVLWVDTIAAMKANGIETVLELGPGKVLAGLCKRIDRSLNVVSVTSPSDLEKALSLFAGNH